MSLLWTDSSKLRPSNQYIFLNLMFSSSRFFLNMLFPPQLGIKSHTKIFSCVAYGTFVPLRLIEDFIVAQTCIFTLSIYLYLESYIDFELSTCTFYTSSVSWVFYCCSTTCPYVFYLICNKMILFLIRHVHLYIFHDVYTSSQCFIP
jgi:hypothetical protein